VSDDSFMRHLAANPHQCEACEEAHRRILALRTRVAELEAALPLFDALLADYVEAADQHGLSYYEQRRDRWIDLADRARTPYPVEDTP